MRMHSIFLILFLLGGCGRAIAIGEEGVPQIKGNFDKFHYKYKKCDLASDAVFYKIEDMFIQKRWHGKMYWDKPINIYISEQFEGTKYIDTFVKSLGLYFPYKINLSYSDVERAKNKLGVFVYSYSAKEDNDTADFNLFDLRNSFYAHSWRSSIYSEYYITRSFISPKDLSLDFEVYTPLDELFVGKNNLGENPLRRLRSVMIEYYRENIREPSRKAVIGRVNCFVNVDQEHEQSSYLAECLLRSLGFPSSYLDIETEIDQSEARGLFGHYFQGQDRPLISENTAEYIDDLKCISDHYSNFQR